MLDRFKRHPAIAPLIAGGETVEYSAHLIPEGGYNRMPQVYADGVVVVGDAAGFVNPLNREGRQPGDALRQTGRPNHR